MIRAFNRATVIIFILFLIVTAIAMAWEYLYILPEQHCIEGGGWWAPRWHACGQPIRLDKLPKLGAVAPANGAVPPVQNLQTPAKATPAVR